jgi:hypothetical protein
VRALEGEEVLTVHVGAQTLDASQIDNGRAVHALENARIEDILELLHGAAQNMRLAARVNTHVVAGGVLARASAIKDVRGLPYLITHRRRRFALTPCRRAIRSTDTPGSVHLCSAIIRRGCLSVNRETRESAVCHDSAMLRLAKILIQLFADTLRLCVLAFRSSRSIKAENLFLR